MCRTHVQGVGEFLEHVWPSSWQSRAEDYVFAIIFCQAVTDYWLDPSSVALSEELLGLVGACSGGHEACGADGEVLRLFAADHAEPLPGHQRWRPMASKELKRVDCEVNWENCIGPLEIISPVWVYLFMFYQALASQS